MRSADRTQKGVQSTLGLSRTGRHLLTVIYAGNEWDAAIEQAIMDHGVGDRAGVTVIAVPERMV